jgi:hypothetical protein
VPLKVEAFRNAEARAAGRPIWTWEAGSLDEVDGRFLARESRTTSPGIEGRPESTIHHVVESITFGKAHPASEFWPRWDPGAVVNDATTGRVANVPGPSRPAAPESASTASDAVIRAIEPAGWADYAPGLLVGLGVCVLGVGVVLWRRRA